MKKILVGLLALGSISSYAGILSFQSNEEVLNEIMLSLQKHDLECTLNGTEETYKSSELSFKRVFGDDFTLIVRRDSQPVVFISKKLTAKITSVMEVTTDRSYKIVTGLKFKISTANESRVERVNVGTIIDPEYKDVVTEVPDTLLEDLNCK